MTPLSCHRCGAPLGGRSLRAFTVTPQGAECALRDGCDERVAVASGTYRQPEFRVVAKRVLS